MTNSCIKRTSKIRKGKGKLSLVAAVAVTLAAARSAQALSITATYDDSINNDQNAAAIKAAINSVIVTYETLLLNPVSVNVNFSEMTTGLGESSHFVATDTYTDFRAKLALSAFSADDTTALNHLSAGSTNPVNGDPGITMASANARALGIFAGSAIGGSIRLNMGSMNITRGGTIDPAKYDLFAVVAHEMDEILGLGSALPNGGNTTGPGSTPTGAVEPEDLFRYDQFGQRIFSLDPATQAYFSIDGAAQIARFNQTSNSTNKGDFGDWYSFLGGQTPQVQDAYGTHGVTINLGVAEKTALDVVGYTLLTSFTWNPTSTTSGTPPDGAGTWTDGNGPWWNGSSNGTWSSGLNAQFGTAGTASSTAYNVALGSPVTVGTLLFANANYTIAGANALTINKGIVAAVSATINTPVSLGGNNTWQTASGATLTVGGNITGNFGLTKQGPGTLSLSGSNSYLGTTTVGDGTLQLNSAGALPTATNVIISGGALDLHGQSPTIGNLTFGDGISASTSTSVLDSGITKGTMTLGGDITYVGTFNGGFTYFFPGTISANLTLASGTHHLASADATLANNYDLVISGALTGPGGLTKDAVHSYVALTGAPGANTYSGATVINGGWFFAAATNTLSANSDVTVNSPGTLSLNPVNTQTGITPGSYDQTIGSLAGNGQVILGTATLTVGADGNGSTFSGGMFDPGGGASGSGSLTKTGAGTFIVASSLSYTGVTTINNGTLQLGNGTNNGFISSTSGVTGLSTGTLAFDYTGNFVVPISIGGAVNVVQAGPTNNAIFFTGNDTYTGTTTINSGTTLAIGNNGTTGALGTGNTFDNGKIQFGRTDTLLVSSSISGSGAVTVIAGGTIVLTGTNSYQGQTTISNGTLQLGNGGTSGSLGSATLITSGGGNGTLVFNRSDNFTVANNLFNTLKVVQNGAGTTTLSANSSYSGATTVNAGTLLVTGSISGSTTTVNGGTLAGTGFAGPVNVMSGGTVLPGSSTGSGIFSTGDFSLASGAHLTLELGGTSGAGTTGTLFSELNVTGSVSLFGDVQVSLFGGFTPQVNDTFLIIFNDDVDPVSGAFSNAPGNIFTSAGYQFQVNYAANSGNDVTIKVLSAIPEPGTLMSLAGGVAVLLGWRRTRRR